MDDFQDHVLGQVSNQLTHGLIDLHRELRSLYAPKTSPSYDQRQTAAADAVIAAIAHVDAAFRDRRLSDPLRFCDCCTDEAFVERVLTTPAALLSEDDMAEIVASLTLTLGSAEDCVYFTPRICADGLGSPLYDLELGFGRMRKGCTLWSDAERNAMHQFMTKQARFLLATPPDKHNNSLGDTLTFVMCASVCGVLRDVLHALETRTDPFADERLLDILESAGRSFDTYGIICEPDRQLLGEWLRSDPIAPRITALREEVERTSAKRAARISAGIAELTA